MMTFDQLENIVGEIDSWDGGISDDRLKVLKKVINEVGLSLQDADPVRVIEVSHMILRNAPTESSAFIAADIVETMLEQWLDRQKCPAKYERAA